jgi:hypothetical protein
MRNLLLWRTGSPFLLELPKAWYELSHAAERSMGAVLKLFLLDE